MSGQPGLGALVTGAAWLWSRRDSVDPALAVRALLKRGGTGSDKGNSLSDDLDPGKETVSLRGGCTSLTWVRGLDHGSLARAGQIAFYKVACLRLPVDTNGDLLWV